MTIISTGNVTVTNGDVNVSGVGTSFATSLVGGGTLLVNGVVAFIHSATDDTNLILTKPWTGATAAGVAYEIQRVRADVSNVAIANDRLADVIRRLQGFTVFKPDAVGTFANRAQHDNEAKDFIYVVPAEIEGGSPTTYFKLSDTAGDWSTGQVMKGDKGDAGNPQAATTAFAETMLDDADAEAVLATLGLPSGASQFMRRSDAGGSWIPRTFAQVRGDLSVDNLAGHRNKIRNGDHRLAQEGVVFVIPAGQAWYTVDGWVVFNNADQAVTVTQEPHTIGQTLVPGEPEFFLRASYSTAPTTGLLYFIQRIENVRTLANELATTRYYFATTETSILLHHYLAQAFGSGGSSGVGFTVQTETIGATSFVPKGDKVNVPSISGKVIGANGFLEWVVQLTPREAATYDISRCSVVPGDATQETDPFAPRDETTEDLINYRHFQILRHPSIAIAWSTVGVNATAQWLPMRATPSLSALGPLQLVLPGANYYLQSAAHADASDVYPDGGIMTLNNFTSLNPSSSYICSFQTNENFISLNARI